MLQLMAVLHLTCCVFVLQTQSLARRSTVLTGGGGGGGEGSSDDDSDDGME